MNSLKGILLSLLVIANFSTYAMSHVSEEKFFIASKIIEESIRMLCAEKFVSDAEEALRIYINDSHAFFRTLRNNVHKKKYQDHFKKISDACTSIIDSYTEKSS